MDREKSVIMMKILTLSTFPHACHLQCFILILHFWTQEHTKKITLCVSTKYCLIEIIDILGLLR